MMTFCPPGVACSAVGVEDLLSVNISSKAGVATIKGSCTGSTVSVNQIIERKCKDRNSWD
jgi:hypothetical protein